jgi:hypothetical protein
MPTVAQPIINFLPLTEGTVRFRGRTSPTPDLDPEAQECSPHSPFLFLSTVQEPVVPTMLNMSAAGGVTRVRKKLW